MKTFETQTMQDVEQFLRYVIEPNGLALGMGFHPDEDFSDYMKKNGEKAFSNNEAKALNEMTSKCFDICEKQNEDIYAIALSIINGLNNGR
ncbi:MAG: hypothetical protein IKO75_09270 [Bacteroidales bacterium]|nr:hypothetical protein [Bacteroidales bacterium]